MTASLWSNWLNPLHGDGYLFWSGIGSGSPLLGIIGVYWHHHKCAYCWRPGKTHPDHGHACKHHR